MRTTYQSSRFSSDKNTFSGNNFLFSYLSCTGACAYMDATLLSSSCSSKMRSEWDLFEQRLAWPAIKVATEFYKTRMIRESLSQPGVWTTTVYNASIQFKKFKRNLASLILHQFVSRFMGILFPGFWTIRLDRIAYSLVPDPSVTAKIQLNYKTLASPSS